MQNEHLEKLSNGLQALENNFSSTPSIGKRLDDDDKAEFERLTMEAKAVIDDELGLLNDFSNRLGSIMRSASGVGPSPGELKTARSILEGADNRIQTKGTRPRLGMAVPGKSSYVGTERITQIKLLPRSKWDFTRLVRLLEEVNITHEHELHMATAMVVRAITDHVPPIFGQPDFARVANNHSGTQSSFKKSTTHLHDSLRNIANSHLHQHIRQSEVLPGPQQVDFKADLDVLLGEIVRLIKP